MTHELVGMQRDYQRELDLIEKLRSVNTVDEFRFWIRCHLRRAMPHACFLATVGTLYGLGSIPTHRISADFPLSILEEMKDSRGAIVDPMVASWFKTSRLKLFDLQEVDGKREPLGCSAIFRRYGIRNILVHGNLEYKNKRFVLFQLANVFTSHTLDVAKCFSSIMPDLSAAALRVIANGALGQSSQSFGNPTFSLTAAELHIIELLAQGLSNKQIARMRGVSDSTVKTQVQRTGAKLGATRRAEIVAIAMPFLTMFPRRAIDLE